ncbi:MAG: response regulator [Lentisphaerae bacterium]|nr:response regulator [Lentisphaerota bacterium]
MKTILIVDDDEALVESVTDVLTTEGYSVITAANGEIGYNMAVDKKPDLILLDVMMTHDHEGFGVAKKLRQNDVTRKLPIIIITGIRKARGLPFGYEPDEDWLPVQAVLEKPVDPSALLRHVKNVFLEAVGKQPVQ